nr:MAG TPA: hypothetical protein [Caudoviricetes sp.]
MNSVFIEVDKLIDSIPVRDKPAKTVTVRTRLL